MRLEPGSERGWREFAAAAVVVVVAGYRSRRGTTPSRESHAHTEASAVSELPRRTSRRSLSARDAQPADAGTSSRDTGALMPAVACESTTDARPVSILGARDIEAIAVRVAELLERPSRRLLKVDEVAALLAVDPAFVYAHQRELGVLRLPTRGRRPALRFDRDAVLELLRQRAGQRPPTPARRRPKPPQRRAPDGVELLPYEPRSAA